LDLEARASAKYRPVHLRHSRRIVRLYRRNHDLDAFRPAEARNGNTDHLLMAHPHKAECAHPAAPAPRMGEPPAAQAALHPRDGICERPAAYAARDAEYDRPRLRRRAGAVKRPGSPSGFGQEKTVAFEASEGGAGEDDNVKNYDADGACSLSRCAIYSLVCANACDSSDEGRGICWHWRYCE
jgi:hypothetical protein